jgi:hypothetical protein
MTPQSLAGLLLAPVAGSGPPSPETSKNLLLAAAFALLAWQVGMRLVAYVSGWRRVANRYGRGYADQATPRLAVDLLAAFRYRISMWYFTRANVGSGGLDLELPFIYAGHAALLLSWQAIELSSVRADGEDWIQLKLAGEPRVCIRLREKRFRELLAGTPVANVLVQRCLK